MSYILDALRRADAERDRGSIPGLHAQPMAGAPLPALRGGATARWWIALAALTVLLAVLLTALLLRRPEPAQLVAGVTATPAAALPQPTAAPVESAPPPVPQPAATAELATPAVRPARAAARPASSAGSASAPAATSPLRLDAQPATAAARPSSVAASAAPEARVPDLKELPEDLRRQVPALTVGGASYSANAASRMLIINGQVFHEKDPIGPDHVLEQISLKSAVLRFRGTRYSISY